MQAITCFGALIQCSQSNQAKLNEHRRWTVYSYLTARELTIQESIADKHSEGQRGLVLQGTDFVILTLQADVKVSKFATNQPSFLICSRQFSL